MLLYSRSLAFSATPKPGQGANQGLLNPNAPRTGMMVRAGEVRTEIPIKSVE